MLGMSSFIRANIKRVCICVCDMFGGVGRELLRRGQEILIHTHAHVYASPCRYTIHTYTATRLACSTLHQLTHFPLLKSSKCFLFSSHSHINEQCVCIAPTRFHTALFLTIGIIFRSCFCAKYSLCGFCFEYLKFYVSNE